MPENRNCEKNFHKPQNNPHPPYKGLTISPIRQFKNIQPRTQKDKA